MAAILRNGARDELVRAGLQILADVTLSNTETAQIVITAGGVEAAVSLLQRNEALLGAREEACRTLVSIIQTVNETETLQRARKAGLAETLISIVQGTLQQGCET